MLPLHRHYMIILFPLQFVWLARLALGGTVVNAPAAGAGRLGFNWGRSLLAVLVVCQGLITMQFLNYVHDRPLLKGDYGVPYRRQDPTHQAHIPNWEKAVQGPSGV
jgi:hypothetical protein